MLQDQWSGIVWPASEAAERDPPTGVKAEILEKVGRASVSVPEGFVSLPLYYRAITGNVVDIGIRPSIRSLRDTSIIGSRVSRVGQESILLLQKWVVKM